MLHPIPSGDVLIHCGDFTSMGRLHEIQEFLDWFSSFPHKHKILIAGNHDRSLDSRLVENPHTSDRSPINAGMRTTAWIMIDQFSRKENNHFLFNQGITIDGVKFWGSPYTPWFRGEIWAFNVQRGDELKELWEEIPDDTNVLITHGPPMTDGFLDYTYYDKINVGCNQLAKRIEDLKDLKVHCFGHIHEGYGYKKHKNGAHLVNASICDLRYDPVNEPVIIDI